MKSLFFNYDMNVEQAYIIRIKDNPISELLANRCSQSCLVSKQPHSFWDAYDGTGETIKPPYHHSSFMSMMKVSDHYLTRGEVACALSHISLWARCVEIDKPIVIFEHDAISLKPYLNHKLYNSISFLGCREQYKEGWPIYSIPPHASEGPNYHYICRAHAYAIDPAVAKNLIAHVLQKGIHAPLDWMIRADLFCIHQTELYAYDEQYHETTIKSRPKDGRTTKRNDSLSW